MRILLSALFILTSSSLFAAMGYLGGYPYTETTAQKVDKFKGGTPPPPAPGRRAQYSYMAVPLSAPTLENISAPIKDKKKSAPVDDFDDGGFDDGGFDDDMAFDEGADDPFLADDMFEDDFDDGGFDDGGHVNWDDL